MWFSKIFALCYNWGWLGYRPPVPHVDEVGDTVEGRHADVRQGEVDEEVVGDAPHAPVGCNKRVASDGGVGGGS